MRLAATAFFCAVSGTVFAQHYSTDRPGNFVAAHEKPSLAKCEELYYSGSFVLNQFEQDSISKERSLGKQALDERDFKWIMSAENRRASCMQLLRENGKLRWRDQLLLWWYGD